MKHIKYVLTGLAASAVGYALIILLIDLIAAYPKQILIAFMVIPILALLHVLGSSFYRGGSL